MEYKRLTTDNPITNDDELLNFAYAKDNKVVLRHAEGISDVDLCKFIQRLACDVTAEEIMEGACFECENFEHCIYGIAYALGVQAAELRGILKIIEDKIENSELVEQKQDEWKHGELCGQQAMLCSLCGTGFTGENAEWISKEHDYCPKCGAKMR